MKIIPQIFALCSLFFAVTAVQAQWKNETYSLKPGWNAIYLHGDATYASPDVLFALGQAANIDEVWRWNPNPSEIQFTESPLVTSQGTPEWATWVRGAAGNTLNALKGQSGYLVKCGPAQASYEVTILQQALPPSATWMRTGANLLGFPAKTVGINANGTAGTPKFADYFATFPAAIAANTEIYKYVGGDLGQDNPLAVFSPTMETLDRNKAYWFSSKVVGDFYAPISIELSNLDGIAFGNAGSVVTALLSNRTASAVTLTLNHVLSQTPPAGETAVTAQVPLTRGSREGLNWVYTDLQTGVNDTVLIGPRSTVEVRFGIDRAGAMTATAVGSYFASLLQVTDSGNLMDVYLPVSATKSSLSGLWSGDIEVTSVDSRVAADGRATAEVTVDGSGVVTGVAVSDGGFDYDTTPTVVVPSADGLTLGMSVIGTGLSAGASITSIIDGTHLKLSQNLPAGTVSLAFGGTTLSSTGANTSTITVDSTSGLTEGMTVVGPGISGTATIVSITDATTFVLSQAIPAGTNDLVYGAIVLASQVVSPTPLSVVIAAPPGSGGIQATATASVSNGAITGFTITNGGSGYAVPPAQAPQVTITAPLSGAVPRSFPLRMLLHVADDGTARMLSQVFMGNLDGGGTDLGLCTKEAGLNPDQKASAMRIAVAHLPLDQVIDGSSPGTNTGSVAPGSALVRTVVIAHDDPTNPFLHQYHPDHDSRDARPDGTDVPLGEGVESYAVTRTCSFTFSVTPPSGVSSIGWGANVIGGTYSEIFRGLHRDALITSGTFILRRVSEIGAIIIND
jgi:hypothetical protein